ncbi:unnamed protein product [Dovyalis caffra]|uniref:Uncharacterized protein n=1 Tax=Dovyalis caffra TaxID=77055 RepID=A0AAV1S7B7_9ROSI|nr:unnamed protein product [Dovyalis caffra]
MEKQQELEWAEAQKIATSLDLVAAAKKQLRFLAEVDRHRYLYDGHTLERAIHRNDCKELYGRILGTRNVVSSTQAVCKKQTEEFWNRIYPNEPYELNPSTQLVEGIGEHILVAQKSTNYDLVSAVKRQRSFYYQVSGPHMEDDTFLEEAVARYKGFLYLIKRNQERSIKHFSVPTYDVDLIWHSHQLHPVSYCKDLVAIIGRVLEHDDTDSDRSKGKKLDTGFSGTTEQWEETFGSRYWKAGAMHRGDAPSSLKINLSELDILNKNVTASNEYQSMIQLPDKRLIEVMVEIVEVRDLPAGHNGSLSVILGKKQPDSYFNGRRMSIFSETGEKDVAVFRCKPTGELIFKLMSHPPSLLHIASPAKMLGTTSISLHDLMKPGSPLSIEKWFALLPNSGIVGSKPVRLRIAFSFTPSVQAPLLLHMVQTRACATSCFFPLPGTFQQGKIWTCIEDEDGNEIINLLMRVSMKAEAKNNCLPKKEVIGMTRNGERHVLAEFAGTGWSLMNSNWWFQPYQKITDASQIFELTGSQKVIIFPGRKLEYEIKCEKFKSEQNFLTAVKFSAEYPHGQAVALFDLKSASLEVNEDWLGLPGILLAFLLSDTSRNESNSQFHADGDGIREMDSDSKQHANKSYEEDKTANQIEEIKDATKATLQMAYISGAESYECCDCGAVAQVDLTAGKSSGIIKDGTGEESHSNGAKAIINSAICSNCVAPVGSESTSHIILEDVAKSPHCGGCGSCHGGCGSCHGGGCHGDQ